MSSHHFVKEGQEPALLILDEVDSSLVQPLLEWSPLVIVAEAAVHHVLAWGIKIDVLLASDEGIDELKIAMRDQAPLEILPCRPDNCLTTALRFLEGTSCEAVNICASHAESVMEKSDSFSGRIQVAVLGSDIRWLLIRAAAYKKWLPAGAELRVVGSGDIHTSGLERRGEKFVAGQEGLVSIESTPPFWVGEAQ